MLPDKHMIHTFIGTAVLGLLSWQLMTLQNLTRSVEVLANQIKNDGHRIQKLEEYRDYEYRRDRYGDKE